MKSLQEYILEAAENKIAIGHFNVSTLDGIWAVADAAQALKVPVIIGVSEGERDYVGVRQAATIVNSIRQERNQPIFINADHTYSFERVKEAILAGFDAVIYDGAKLSLAENIEVTKKCVAFASEHKSLAGNRILIEGELGYIGSSSKILDAVPEGAAFGEADLTKPEDAARFVTETGIDLLAPAIGNIHGVIRGGDPALNIERAEKIRQAITIPLVLHGASGNTALDIEKTIKVGTAIVHVNTELRIAYRSGLVKSLSDDHEELSPYKYLKAAKLAMQKVVEEKIRIFAGI